MTTAERHDYSSSPFGERWWEERDEVRCVLCWELRPGRDHIRTVPHGIAAGSWHVEVCHECRKDAA